MEKKDCVAVCASCCDDCKGICIMQCEDAYEHDEMSPLELCNGSCNECSPQCETACVERKKDQ
jgi:hypothetical protein